MSEYGTLYAIARNLDVPAVIPPHMKDRLQKLFPNISIPMFKKNDCSKKQEWKTKYQDLVMDRFRTNTVVLMDWYDVREMCAYRRDLIRNDFQISDSLRQSAQAAINVRPFGTNDIRLFDDDFLPFQDMISKFRTSNPGKPVPQNFVSVHVRRTDYEHHLSIVNPNGGKFLSRVYYQNAMKYFRSRLDNVLFVGMS